MSRINQEAFDKAASVFGPQAFLNPREAFHAGLKVYLNVEKKSRNQKMQLGLTRPARAALIFIQNYFDTEKVYPTFDEIKNGLGYKSKSRVWHLLVMLEERGYIERQNFRRRGMKILKRIDPTNIPHEGIVK